LASFTDHARIALMLHLALQNPSLAPWFDAKVRIIAHDVRQMQHFMDFFVSNT
jgi:hypothetical protein